MALPGDDAPATPFVISSPCATKARGSTGVAENAGSDEPNPPLWGIEEIEELKYRHPPFSEGEPSALVEVDPGREHRHLTVPGLAMAETVGHAFTHGSTTTRRRIRWLIWPQLLAGPIVLAVALAVEWLR